MIVTNDNETNSPHKLSLADRPISKFCRVLANQSSDEIKLLKTQ